MTTIPDNLNILLLMDPDHALIADIKAVAPSLALAVAGRPGEGYLCQQPGWPVLPQHTCHPLIFRQ